MFRSWDVHLPADIEVVSIQLPGRENRVHEPACRSVEVLAAKLARVLAPELDRPFAIFGHSMGGLVAFELARNLRRAGGAEPRRLIVSGHGGPRRSPSLPLISAAADAEVLARLRRLGGTPEEALRDEQLMAIVLPLFRADLAVCETYAYAAEDPLGCPISAYGGTLDKDVRRQDLGAWQAESRGPIRVRMFPGGHFFIRESMDRVMEAIGEDLAEPGDPVLTRECVMGTKPRATFGAPGMKSSPGRKHEETA